MIYLCQLSIPSDQIRDLAFSVDPLVASDPGYALKIWMATHPGVALRPWSHGGEIDGFVRVTGWRAAPAISEQIPGDVRLSQRTVSFERHEEIRIVGTFIPVRRATHDGRTVARDPGAILGSPRAAYKQWIDERLIDVMPHLDIRQVRLIDFDKLSVLRKTQMAKYRAIKQVRIPIASAEVLGVVGEPLGVEAWLLKGVGTQKAFGFGSFVPC